MDSGIFVSMCRCKRFSWIFQESQMERSATPALWSFQRTMASENKLIPEESACFLTPQLGSTCFVVNCHSTLSLLSFRPLKLSQMDWFEICYRASEAYCFVLTFISLHFNWRSETMHGYFSIPSRRYAVESCGKFCLDWTTDESVWYLHRKRF